ncbi:MAG: hypothetical protein ACO1OB_08570 [Archangium sp.]
MKMLIICVVLGSAIAVATSRVRVEPGKSAGTLKRLAWAVHSANPAGRKNIEAALQAAERFWKSA